jgi:NADH:ubiquinone oxidoreductase subunit 2 (subunit N)
MTAPALVAIVAGGGLLAVATALSLRARSAASSFSWMVIAAFACCVLGLAAALHAPGSDGFRAGVVQLVAAALAAAVGVLLTGRKEGEEAPKQTLATAARGVAWLTLLGLPPTLGFHAKVMLYRALLAAEWGSLAALAMAAAAAAMLPAAWALGSPPPLPLKGARALVVAALVAAMIALGCYPQISLSLADLAEKVARPG